MEFDFLFLQVAACPDCLWKVILMFLLALLLGLLLGYIIWGKYKKMVAEAKNETAEWHGKYNTLESDFASLRYKYDELEKDNNGYKTTIRRLEADKATLDAQLVRLRNEMNVVGSGQPDGGAKSASLLPDSDLQIVEGIGPKIEEILKAKKIKTWADLAATPVDQIKSILDEAGPNFRIHDPSTWPKQALLAMKGDWEKLIAMQRGLDGGVEGKGDGDTPSKAEKAIIKKLGFHKFKTDDLKIVEGIGPKIEEALNAAGIKTWKDLAGSSVKRIQDILDQAEGNFNLADPKTWSQQVELAVEGRWLELKALQDELIGGKKA
ncbi:MAG: hypothetical protein KDC32_03670 [Saprospiraceae bacterium]|nr:hypothetical protein [Saprospiraceae bacterium]MCB0675278.1 hypothetical protein [Saprospiraceae bacterium]MCB0680041.1 hypothetical protein [Saprospiraceae bacterium]